MSNLLQQIKADRAEHLKAGNKAQYKSLGVLVGEIDSAAKRSNEALSDTMVQQIISKNRKSLLDMLSYKPDDVQLKAELVLLDSYLPQKLSNEKLTEIITGLIQVGSNATATIMAHLKQNYNGLYDGKQAVEIVKQVQQYWLHELQIKDNKENCIGAIK